MTDYYRIRRFLGLRQLDVSLATGVSVQRLSLGERGLIVLDSTESRLIQDFLAERVKSLAEQNRASNGTPPAPLLAMACAAKGEN